MNRSFLPLVAAGLGLALTGCDPVVTSAARETGDSLRATAPPASRSWTLDFESDLPHLRMESSSATLKAAAALNERSPLSGKRDLLVSAILQPSDSPVWASVWLPVSDQSAVDARRAIGIRFKAKSNQARSFTLMLDSDAYPSSAVRFALNLELAAKPSEYSVYFSQFCYSPRLTQPGGLCSSQGGDPSLCRATLSEVVARLRAFHGFLVPRTDAARDTAIIQLDDLRLLFEDDLLL